MKTKITNEEKTIDEEVSTHQDREPITLTVFAILFIITLGMYIMSS